MCLYIYRLLRNQQVKQVEEIFLFVGDLSLSSIFRSPITIFYTHPFKIKLILFLYKHKAIRSGQFTNKMTMKRMVRGVCGRFQEWIGSIRPKSLRKFEFAGSNSQKYSLGRESRIINSKNPKLHL